MSVETRTETAGRRVVGYLYAAAVGLAAGFGYLIGIVIQPNLDANNAAHIGSLGPVTFALTPLNLAVYGAVMIGVLLGVFFLAAGYATRFESTDDR